MLKLTNSCQMNPSGEGTGKQFEKKRITELSYLINLSTH